MWKKIKYKSELKDFYNSWKEHGYLTKAMLREIQAQYQSFYQQLKHHHLNIKIHKFKKFYRTLEKQKIRHNQVWMDYQKLRYKEILSVKGYKLDSEQQEAVLSEEKNHLVLAGAGSGKSLTIIGKLKYLILVKKIAPEDILCLTFTKEAVQSLKKAVLEELNVNLEVLTFHKLGYQIIKQFEPEKRLTNPHKLSTIINEYFQEIGNDEQKLKELIHYFLYWLPYQVDLEMVTFDKNYKNLKKEEVILCNYFFYNQIPYRKVNHHIDDLHFSTIILIEQKITLQFYPLFNNYFETIEKIRRYHKQRGSKVIEFYPIDFLDNTIVLKLEELKATYDMNVQPIKPKLMYQAIRNSNHSYFMMLKKQLETFLHLLKASGGTLETIHCFQDQASRNPILFFRCKEQLFFSLLELIYLRYSYFLQEQNELDFDDMLLLSTQFIQRYGCYKQYQYILIDEYQDTSYARYNLVKSIQEKTGAKIFAVGDDWQSIYRFTGCNLNLFLNFSEMFGDAEILKIQTTYRNSQQLIAAAGTFIMQNKKQIKKHLISFKTIDKPFKIVIYENKLQSFKALLLSFPNCLKKDLFLLGRNHQDLFFFASDKDFLREGNRIWFKLRPNLLLTFYTVHASKGLEATDVILLNNEEGVLGFPNQILEDSVFQYLNQTETFPFEEERRLFYVALTRAKEHCYLLVPKKNPSSFFLEFQKLAFSYLEYFPGNKKQ